MVDVDFGCDYCADDQNRWYGYVTQIASDEQRRMILIRCPRCGTLYENTPTARTGRGGSPRTKPQACSRTSSAKRRPRWCNRLGVVYHHGYTGRGGGMCSITRGVLPWLYGPRWEDVFDHAWCMGQRDTRRSHGVHQNDRPRVGAAPQPVIPPKIPPVTCSVWPCT